MSTISRAFTKDIGDVIAMLLAAEGRTRLDLADAAGLPKSNVYRWIKGEGRVSVEALEPIAAYFGMDAAELILLAIQTRPGGGPDGGLGAAIEKVRPTVDRLRPVRKARNRRTGT